MNIVRSALIPPLIVSLFVCCTDSSTDDNGNHEGVPVFSETVQDIISRANLDSLTLRIRELSGEVFITVNGERTTITTRHSDYPGNDLAADFIQQKLESYELEVTSQYFNGTVRNVLAEQQGIEFPDRKFIISAHYDSMPDSSIAPGADDNGSGIATVLEAARILSEYACSYSIVYALWDEEEQGLIGSRAYAYEAMASGEDIEGVLNIDMIGYDGDGVPMVQVNTTTHSGSEVLSDKAIAINELYSLGLSFDVRKGGGRSDHASFMDYDIGAISLLESIDYDINPYYHSVDDRLANMDLEYFYSVAKLAIGTFATMVGLGRQ